VRRFLLIQALMLWQGGFLFYTSFVVPTGTRVLGSAEAQGAITARVTDSLNLCGAVALGLMLWDGVATRSRVRLGLTLLMAMLQGWLFVLHLQLDGLMDTDRTFVVRRASFYPLHRTYLIVSTVQWVLGLGFIASLIRDWHRPVPPASTPSP
jgi:hypothetical protein